MLFAILIRRSGHIQRVDRQSQYVLTSTNIRSTRPETTSMCIVSKYISMVEVRVGDSESATPSRQLRVGYSLGTPVNNVPKLLASQLAAGGQVLRTSDGSGTLTNVWTKVDPADRQ